MKNGITMVSMVIYVLLFFSFTVIAISISSNLNKNIITDKSISNMNKDYLKLYTNILSSAKNSNSFDFIDNTVSFSNNDIYTFKDKCIYKNNEKIISNVTSMSLGTINNLDNINKDKLLVLDITLNKNKKDFKDQVIVCVGVNNEI
ncbi:MAG: hypothetical protein RSC92_03380 [Clostridia bacterium]